MSPEVKSLSELGLEKVTRSMAFDGIRMSLREYAEKLRALDEAKELVKQGTLEPGQMLSLLEDAHRILRNSQILALSNVSEPPPFMYIGNGPCSNCNKDVDVITFCVSKTWRQLWSCSCGAPFPGSETVHVWDSDSENYRDEEHEIALEVLDRVLGRIIRNKKSWRK